MNRRLPTERDLKSRACARLGHPRAEWIEASLGALIFFCEDRPWAVRAIASLHPGRPSVALALATTVACGALFDGPLWKKGPVKPYIPDLIIMDI